MTGPISFRVSTPAATPIQRSASPVATPQSPSPSPVRTAQAFRNPTQTGAKPIDVQSETLSINTTIDRSQSEQVQANASRLNQLGLVPGGFPKITSSELQNARQNLQSVSQHQVLNLNESGESDSARSTVTESGRSVKLRQGGTPFGVGIPLKPGATVDVVGHGSPDGKTVGGKTPQQLAKQLKDGGATELAVLDLKSCHSEAFKAELEQCLESEGIQVGQIKTYEGTIAISRETGKVLQGSEISTNENDGLLTAYQDLTAIRSNLSDDASDLVTTDYCRDDAVCWNWVLHGGRADGVGDPRVAMSENSEALDEIFTDEVNDGTCQNYLEHLIQNYGSLSIGAENSTLRAIGYFNPDIEDGESIFMEHIELSFRNDVTITKGNNENLKAFRGISEMPDGYIQVSVPIDWNSLNDHHKAAFTRLSTAIPVDA